MDATGLCFELDGPPVAQPRPRVSTWGGRGRAYVPKDHPVHAYRQAIQIRAALAAKAARWETATGPVEVVVQCWFARPASHLTKSVRGPASVRAGAPAWPPRVDVDNLAKAVLDALSDSGAVWEDDDQVVRLVVSKGYAARPFVQVTVRRADP